MDQKLILDQQAIEQTIRRIAYQIYENNIDAELICLVGIEKQGQALADKIAKELSGIDDKIKVASFLIKLDKKNPKGSVQLQAKSGDLDGSVVVLIDDVLNTGRTIAHSIIPLMDENILKIEIAVLVDRGHRTYPVSASYSGIQLATTLEEHIEVQLGKKPKVVLF